MRNAQDALMLKIADAISDYLNTFPTGKLVRIDENQISTICFLTPEERRLLPFPIERAVRKLEKEGKVQVKETTNNLSYWWVIKRG